MNAVSGIFVALALGGYALDKIYLTVKRAAVERIQRGQPSLSDFTNRLTCSKIAMTGTLVPVKCGHHQRVTARYPWLSDI
jgi:hypothetical protein